jgi:hypothetical protein
MSVEDAEVSVEVAEDGGLLVGVDSPSCSVALRLDADPDGDDVEEALRTALRETRHTRSLSRRSGR